MGKETVLALLLREKGRFVSGESYVNRNLPFWFTRRFLSEFPVFSIAAHEHFA